MNKNPNNRLISEETDSITALSLKKYAIINAARPCCPYKQPC